MTQDIITKIETTYVSDGQGGFKEETREIGSYDVKLSVSKDVKKAAAYGVQCEQMLEVVADEPLVCCNGNRWIIIGQQGRPGLSAYEIAVEAGFEGTEEEWLQSLHSEINFDDLTEEEKELLKGADGAPGKDGLDGPPGADGKSAYQIALDNGFEGTEEEWLDSLKSTEPGPKGDKGNSAWVVYDPNHQMESYSVAGDIFFNELAEDAAEVGDEGVYIAPSSSGDIYMAAAKITEKRSGGWYVIFSQNPVKISGYSSNSGETGGTGADGKSAYQIALENGFIGTVTEWLESLKGDTGLSAYEVAVKNGFEGTEEEWLESLKGEDGQDGSDYILTDEDKQEIADLVEVNGGTGSTGSVTANDVSFDDSTAGLGIGQEEPVDNVQKAIEALANDNIGSQEVQDMIDENIQSFVNDFGPYQSFFNLLINGITWGVDRWGTSGNTPSESLHTKEEILQKLIYRRGTVQNLSGSSITIDFSKDLDRLNQGAARGISAYVLQTNGTVKTSNTTLTIPNNYYCGWIGSKILIVFQNSAKLRDFLAKNLRYDNTTSGLTANTLSAAIDELAARPSGGNDNIIYIGTNPPNEALIWIEPSNETANFSNGVEWGDF